MVQQARHRAVSLALLATWGEYMREHSLYTKAIKPSKRVWCSPARSSTYICQRGALRQRPGGSNTPCRVCSQTKGAGYTLGLIRQDGGIHYPVGQPLLEDSLSLLLASVTDEELLWGPKALRTDPHICAKHERDRAKLGLGLLPPWAALPGSKPDPWKAWWEPWAHIRAGVSG